MRPPRSGAYRLQAGGHGGKPVPTISYKGRQVEAEDVGFNVMHEEWNTYQLHDGTEIRMRLVVKVVAKIPDEVDSEGNPVYLVQSSNVLVVKPPK